MENMTAKVSCFARAWHYRNNSVRIFSDDTAEKLLGEDYDRIAASMSRGIGFFLPEFRGSAEDGLRLIVEKQLAPSVLGRSAYCESVLKNEIQLGCRQYVLFASGFDTFAIRNRDVSLAVFELDLPDMLADKQKRIEKAGLSTGAVWVPCNLSDASWKDRLGSSGFRKNQRAFGSLLGISYYLEKEDFRQFLLALGRILCKGSAVCFDYPSADDSRETQVNRALAAGAGERMKARYDDREIENLLEECGFLTYEHLDHNDMTERFFMEYNRQNPEHRMEAPKGVRYILAVRKEMPDVTITV